VILADGLAILGSRPTLARVHRLTAGDRVPPGTPADAPPGAAPARGDLCWPARSEPAPAVHAPHGQGRCAGRQAFNRLIEPTHRKARGYPARTLPCVRFKYFWAYHSSASGHVPRPRPGGSCSGGDAAAERNWPIAKAEHVLDGF
jgi:hypothetical protein